jgi:hydrophobe/amphiphile efflux-3 (HAE3) family protein
MNNIDYLNKKVEGDHNNSKKIKTNPLAWIVGISTDHPWKIIIIFILIMIIFLIPTSQLTVDSSMEGMFGGEVPSEIKKFEQLAKDFGEQELVTIVVDVHKSNATTAQNYLEDLAIELEKDKDFTDINYKQKMDIADENFILYLPEESLLFLLDPNATINQVQGSYQYIINSMNEPSYFVSDNGNIYLLNMILNGSIESAEQRTIIFDDLYKKLDEVQDSKPDYKNLEVGFTGSMAVVDYEGDKMAMNDVMITFVITFVLILILLFISFRSISLPALALVPLLFGIVITAGLIYIIYGAMSMIAAFFAVLLLGLGIDFSIHILTRFTEEMEKHDDIKKAFHHTAIGTGKAVVLGTLTTATAFGALVFSKTGGMHQMGAILAIGLIVTMISVLFVLPALITLRLKYGKKLRMNLQKKAKFHILKNLGSAASKYAALLVIILIIFGAFVIFESQDIKVNENIHELQPKTVPSYKQLEKVKENFNYTEDYILCVATGYDDLVRSVEGFKGHPEIMEVESILDFIPQDKNAKLSIIEQSKTLHPEFENISWLNPGSMNWSDLPIDIRESWVSGEDGEPGSERFLIRLKAYGNVWEKEYREDLVSELKEINQNVVGRSIAFTQLIEVLTQEVIWVCIFAAIPILIIVYIGFGTKNPVYALLAVIPVLFGLGGVLGFGEYIGVDLNMISIMMIPLIIGIGIDDGIHILHRYKEEGPGSIPKVVQNTGKAVFLTTATTCLAFSSFLIADHPGMRPMGGVPVLGLTFAFIASVIFIPALIVIIINGKKKMKEK